MGMKEAVTNVFNNYFNFEGRARRSEYWYFCLFNILVGLVFAALIAMVREGGVLYRLFYGLSSLFSLAVFIPGLAVCWRRLHDIGKSGANYFWILLPIAGPILLLVWFAREGDCGDNAFGPDPKAAERFRDQYEQF